MDKKQFKNWATNIAYVSFGKEPVEEVAKFDPKAAELLKNVETNRNELVAYLKTRLSKDNN